MLEDFFEFRHKFSAERPDHVEAPGPCYVEIEDD